MPAYLVVTHAPTIRNEQVLNDKGTVPLTSYARQTRDKGTVRFVTSARRRCTSTACWR